MMSRTVVAWTLLLLAGCEEPAAPGSPPTPFERDLQDALIACTLCHNPSTKEAGLDLSDPWALVGVRSTQANMDLIVPGNHIESYLWHKVNGTQGISGGMGQRMPAEQPWSEEAIGTLGVWIDLGLPE